MPSGMEMRHRTRICHVMARGGRPRPRSLLQQGEQQEEGTGMNGFICQICLIVIQIWGGFHQI